jgi:hypothetical protein
MAAPNITPTTRFFAVGITRVVYCASVSVKSAPTRAEINAGTDLSNEINATNGWSVGSNLIDAPDIGTTFTSKVIGRTESPDSSLTMYQSLTTADIRSVLPRGTTGLHPDHVGRRRHRPEDGRLPGHGRQRSEEPGRQQGQRPAGQLRDHLAAAEDVSIP